MNKSKSKWHILTYVSSRNDKKPFSPLYRPLLKGAKLHISDEEMILSRCNIFISERWCKTFIFRIIR